MKNLKRVLTYSIFCLLMGHGVQAQIATTNLGVNSGTTGNFNTFIGANSGQNNVTGSMNAFLRPTTGLFNTTGAQNNFFGNFSFLLSNFYFDFFYYFFFI